MPLSVPLLVPGSRVRIKVFNSSQRKFL